MAGGGGAAVRIGIVGCATIARKLCRAISLAPNATLAAVASRSLSKAEAFKSSNNLEDSVRLYGDYESLLDDPSIDAVYIPLPTSLHVNWAVAAAEKKKHILLEKPTAMNVAELDVIIQACDVNGVQFMDGTMWMHHLRTNKMKEVISDPSLFGDLKIVHSNFTFHSDSDFLANDIRTKSDLDGLGALGDAGWYCIRSILWAADYKLPNFVVADRNPTFNDAGVVLSCGATLIWENDGLIATFHCSFQANMSMDLCVTGTKGIIHVNDFIVPFEETAASFTLSTNGCLTELATGWKHPLPSEQVVRMEIPQEARMVVEFSKLVASVRDEHRRPEMKWADITRKTQLVVDSVLGSIENGFKPVDVHQ
ncbi:Oxidoreductase [Zostera marina]|uniref:Oxidoreductase n=1 Tax=Zostera marina TaxID=29655 RepID=A0A0K9Q5N9_ZOSMR|nr:Oxidoreductase [Zostera marina]